MDPNYTECVRVARATITHELISSLKVPQPGAVYRATAIIWLQLIFSWSIALACPLWLVFVPFIIHCGVTQGMLLWVHEASHFTLLPGQRRNDLWCDVFFAAPIGISVAAYRARHMTHHAYLGTERDEDRYPYRAPTKGRRALTLLFLKIFSGGLGLWLAVNKYVAGADRAPPSQRMTSPWLALAMTVVLNLSLLGLCIAVGRWYVYFLVWVYPIVAIAIALNVVRTIAEHQPEDFPHYADGHEITMRPIARTTIPNWLEKWLMYQANFNYHVEHHLYPAVPQHNLHKLHLHLHKQGFYRQFPGSLQRGGFAKFIELASNRVHRDFTGAVKDAIGS